MLSYLLDFRPLFKRCGMSLESVGIDGDRFRQGQVVGNFILETQFCGKANGGHDMTMPSDLVKY